MKSLSGAAAAGACFLLFSGLSVAAEPDEIEQRLRALVPDIESLTIGETPVPGLMEVRLNNEILYMSDDGRYLLQGRMVDLETQTDLTDAAKSGVRREQLANLDPSEFVTFGSEKAEHEILVFTDPDCGYCRRLHEQMAEYNEQGITVHYLAFPRAGVGSDTHEKLVSVWCADDRQDAMDIAKAGGTPEKATCENPVDTQYQLGQSLGVTGTPSMVTFSGDMLPGYVPPEQLRQRLDQTAANSAD